MAYRGLTRDRCLSIASGPVAASAPGRHAVDMLYMDTIDGARAAVSEHRYERAMALAAIAQAEIWADIANALRDDEGNNVAHILHNMSYTLAVIDRNTGAIS